MDGMGLVHRYCGWDDGAMQRVQWCDASGTMVRCKGYDSVRWCDTRGICNGAIQGSAMQGVYTIVRYVRCKGYM